MGQREAAPTHISETSLGESLEDYRETRLGGKGIQARAPPPPLPPSPTCGCFSKIQIGFSSSFLGRILAGAKREMENCIIHPVSSKEGITQRAPRKVEY